MTATNYEIGTRQFSFDNKEFELYQAASGDYCVTISEYGRDREDYNLGSLESAYGFILSYCEA